ncbi:hypothetical protein ACWDR0_33000, partial [Streptomyces sp. NPDC003691]
ECRFRSGGGEWLHVESTVNRHASPGSAAPWAVVPAHRHRRRTGVPGALPLSRAEAVPGGPGGRGCRRRR